MFPHAGTGHAYRLTRLGLAFAAFTAALGSCSPMHDGPDLTGRWKGFGATGPGLDLTITESRSGTLGGTGRTLWAATTGFNNQNYIITSGEHNQPAVTAVLTSTLNADLFGWEAISLTGTVVSADTLSFEMKNDNGVKVTITLTRQP